MGELGLPDVLRRRIIFIGGKGGVGKTVVASALGVLAAKRQLRCLVVSTDPAHSLGDAFDRRIGDVETPICERLYALEIDPDAEALRHIERVTSAMKRFASPSMHGELERQMKLARLSPGTSEAAMLERVANVMTTGIDRYDVIIFDTAPTGHTLRLLSLPEAMGAWTEGLLTRTQRSNDLGKVLSHLSRSAPAKDVATPFDDPELDQFEGMDQRTRQAAQTLVERRRLFHRARRLLTDQSTTTFVFVLIPERLPILETRRAVEALRQFDVPIGGMVVNRVLPEDDSYFFQQRREQERLHLDEIDRQLSTLPKIHLPMLPNDVHGLPALKELAAQIEHCGV